MRTKPLSRELVERELRNRIRSGYHEPGQRLPTERELATEFGVSRGTVQAVLESLASTGYITVRPKCRPVVAFTPSHKPESVTAARTIAVWIQPDLQDLGAAMILQGIRSATEASSFRLQVGFPLTHHQEEERDSEVRFMRELIDQPHVAGAIVWETCAPGFPSIYPALNDLGIPIVFVDREPPEPIEADVIATNHRRGAQKAVNHLLRLGHRHIAMITNDEPASSVRDRIDGYRDALRAAGVQVHADHILPLSADALESDRRDFADFFRDLMARDPAPTAFFCVNDGIALRVERALAQCGFRVPDDVSLVGFDWLLRSLPSGGNLTTVAQPFEAIGRIAAERLLERIRGDKADNVRHILLEAPLIVKSSTAPPPIHVPSRGSNRILVNS